jgi:hypothetical protein
MVGLEFEVWEVCEVWEVAEVSEVSTAALPVNMRPISCASIGMYTPQYCSGLSSVPCGAFGGILAAARDLLF